MPEVVKGLKMLITHRATTKDTITILIDNAPTQGCYGVIVDNPLRGTLAVFAVSPDSVNRLRHVLAMLFCDDVPIIAQRLTSVTLWMVKVECWRGWVGRRS